MSLRQAFIPYYRGAAMSLGPARRFAAWDRYRRLADAVDQLGDDLLILDVGCGRGHVARMLATRHRFVGLDIDPAVLDDYSRYGLAVAGDALALPFDDGVFDVVVSGQTLYELPLDAALAEIGRVLRPGGHLLLEQGMASDVSLWPTLAYWALRRRLPGRLRFSASTTRTTWRTLRRALGRHGLRVLRREGLEIATGPFFSRRLHRRMQLAARAFPSFSSHQLVVARRA